MARQIRRSRRKKPKKLLRRMHNKLYIVFGVLCILFVALIFRLMYIEYTSGEKYEKIVLSQQEYDSTIIPYKRGDIVDSKGTVLATSVDVYNVILDSKVLHANEEKISSTIAYLTQCFPEITADQVNQEITDNPDREYTVLAKHVSYEEKAAFEALMNGEDTKDQIAGIWFEKEYTRTYPYNSLASAMIGFANATTGVIGLENQYNDTLNGTNGRSYGYLNADSNLEQTVIEPENGYSLVATIDTNIQSIVESAILQANEEMKQETEGQATGSNNTAVLVMDPQNGDVLAMASYPNFDLNNPRDLTPWYTTEALAKMSDDDKLNAMNNLWRNFCVSDAFEPGSTAKPFTLATGLETGALTGQETYVCQGGTWKGDWYIQCHNTSGHGTENVDQAIANSCNVALMAMADKIGVEDFIRYQHIFGFGEYTGIDLPGEASTENLIFTAENMGETDLATSSFGQSFNVTMTQMVSAFSSLINGGYYYQPHVVKQIQDENGNVIETNDPTLLRKTVSKQTSDRVKEALRAVMTDGTGVPANVEGYDIGGKTGTAEKLPRGNGDYLLSFIGYAPQENPEVVIYVVIDEPNVENQELSSYVLELSQKIMAETFPYLNITRNGDALPEDSGVREDVQQDFDENFEDTYSNQDGAYIDPNYQPDYDSWATSPESSETTE